MQRCMIALTAITLTSCAPEEKASYFSLKDGVEAVVSITRRGASAQNTAHVSLKDTRSGQSVDIFSGKGGSEPEILLLPDNKIVIAYCGATEITAKSYLYSIGENLNFTDMRIIVATSKMEIQGKSFC